MFDFWNEYKYVVPKGFTRFLGKLSELTDMGVEIHYFTGNHDLWTYGYLEKECGVILHRGDLTTKYTIKYSIWRMVMGLAIQTHYLKFCDEYSITVSANVC